jgi:hypothetical protein
MTTLRTRHQTTNQDLVNPNQKYWDDALVHFRADEPATTAIQNLWGQMPPPASLPTLATIIGALYGNTYWVNTKMDKNLLAADLQAALGINQADCQRAANTAFSMWYGLLVRANMGDSGLIPKSGSMTLSPDVVVNGATALSVAQLIAQWNTYIYTPNPGLKNNTYGRAQSVNIQVPIKSPVLSMYYTDAGMNPPPSSWVRLFTYDGTEQTTLMEGVQPGSSIGVGERCANPKAFAFQPPGVGHFCLITVVGTEFFTNNPSANPGNWNTQEWVQYNGAAGWHNVDVASANQAELKFYNQDGTPEQFVFEAHCSNLPIGTKVSLECEHEDLQYQIRTQPVEITQGYQVVSTEAEVPPNFAGDLRVKFDTPDGKSLPCESSIDVRMDWRLPHGHQHYHQALNQLGDTRSAILGNPVRIPMGNFTFVGLG